MRVPTRSAGHEVGRELEALERAAEHVGDGLDRQRLGQAGHALEQHVAAGEQRHEHALEHRLLADDHALDLEQRRSPARRGQPGAGAAPSSSRSSARRRRSSAVTARLRLLGSLPCSGCSPSVTVRVRRSPPRSTTTRTSSPGRRAFTTAGHVVRARAPAGRRSGRSCRLREAALAAGPSATTPPTAAPPSGAGPLETPRKARSGSSPLLERGHDALDLVDRHGEADAAVRRRRRRCGSAS